MFCEGSFRAVGCLVMGPLVMGHCVMGHFVMGRFVMGRFVCESSAMLCTASKFYRVMLIMAADGAMVCVTQLDGDNLMAWNRVAQ
jgi:hypothetical protein